MKTYTGRRLGDNPDTSSAVEVLVDGQPLSPKPSQKVHNHSPDGFNWGYGGSGPAQLALAILLDFTGDADEAHRLHQQFKSAFVVLWGEAGNRWTIHGNEIREWIDSITAGTVEA